MKVTGTGNPASLTLRLREREIAGLKEELGHRAAVADDAATSPSGQGVASDVRPGPDAPALGLLGQPANITNDANVFSTQYGLPNFGGSGPTLTITKDTALG